MVRGSPRMRLDIELRGSRIDAFESGTAWPCRARERRPSWRVRSLPEFRRPPLAHLSGGRGRRCVAMSHAEIAQIAQSFRGALGCGFIQLLASESECE